MKKILATIAAIAVSFNLDAIPIEKYKDYADQFSPETDLINGLILLNSNLLQPHRFFGPIKFYKKPEEKGNNLSCSFLDTSRDPMTNLLIQLFPSAGDSLNAQGTGSLYSMMESKSVDIIVGMFAIAKDVRMNKGESEILKEINTIEANSLAGVNPFVKKIFGFRAGKKVSERLFNVAKSIAYAVLSEEEPEKEKTDEYKKLHPYPQFYTNYLICAYVWQVLPASQLDDLAKKLSQRLGYSTSGYKSKLTEDIYTDMTSYTSLVPFRPKESIITNGNAHYNGKGFQDCAETAVRQLICSLLCTSKDMPMGELRVDLTGIPADAPIRNFFVTKTVFTDSTGTQQEKEEYKNIRDISNNGSSAARDAWAEIIGGHQEEGVLYNQVDHEMRSGWENLLKSICVVLKGYSAGAEPVGGNEDELNAYAMRKEAADCIAQLNKEISEKTFKMTPERVIESLQKIVKIRTDCKLIVENSKDSGLKQEPGQEIYGFLVIYPEGKKAGNELKFMSVRGHSKLVEIPNPLSLRYSWIEQLHYQGRDEAINGDEWTIREAKYPFLGYLNAMDDHHLFLDCMNDIVNYVLDEEEDAEGVYRALFSEFGRHWDDENSNCSFNKIISLISKENMEMAKSICYCALNHLNSNVLVNAAFFLQNNGDPDAGMNMALSAENKLQGLTIKRLILPAHYKEIDKEIVDYIKNYQQQNEITFDNARYVIDLLSDLNIKYSQEKFKDKFRFFEPEILPLLIPYINCLTEELSKGSNFDISKSLINLLNLINFRQEHPSLNEFKKAVKNYVSKYISLFGTNKISIKFLNDKSLAKLDTILPMVTISDKEEASNIFKQLSAAKALDVSLFCALCEKLSSEEIEDFVGKTTVMNGESALTYLPDIFVKLSTGWFASNNFSKIAQFIGGIDFNMAKAIIEKCIELYASNQEHQKYYTREVCHLILNNMKEDEKIPDILEPYMSCEDFFCIKIIGKDLYNTNSEISNEMALLLNAAREFLNIFDKKNFRFSKASHNALEKMISKLNNKLKIFDKFSAHNANILKIGPLYLGNGNVNGFLKALNNQFYHDMIKENEDGLSEEEKIINENYKKDYEYINQQLTL